MDCRCVKDLFTSCSSLWKTLLATGLLRYLILMPFTDTRNPQLLLMRSANTQHEPSSSSPSQLVNNITNLRHIAFGLMGSVETWARRRGYLEAWWRPNKTRGYVFLNRAPTGELLPWPQTAPPYRVVDNLSELFSNTKPRFELMPRMVHGILELLREEEEEEELRWIVMGDDDSVFFVDNIVDVLAEYDHTKYYYLGWHSESVISNYWFSFQQAFGGGGIVLSYPLARALAKDMDGCLIRYADSTFADLITMTCIADIGVNLTPHKGIHQLDPKHKIPVWDIRMLAGIIPWDRGVKLPLDVSLAIAKKSVNREATLCTVNGKWKVKLVGELGALWFSTGWNEFVMDNAVQQGDWLQFISIGHLRFKVYLQWRVKLEEGLGSEDDVEEDENRTSFSKHMVGVLGTKKGQLNIPMKFMHANNLGLFEAMTLKDPVGRAWDIKLNGDEPKKIRLRMGKGWHDFYVGNGLKEGDKLTFTLVKSTARDKMDFTVAILRC